MPIALITGPTAGIGRAFATALAAEGYDLVLVSRDEARLTELANHLGATYGVGCEVLPADLTDLEQTQRVEARLGELHDRRVDALINNAGFGLNRAFDDTDIDAEQQSMDILVRAVMRLTHAALRPMLDAGRGDIINVSSVAGYLPRGTYSAHKAWVTSFSTWASVRYQPRGVRVMAVCPGFVHTEFHQRMNANMAGVYDWMWLDADDLVRIALKDLRAGKAVSIPTLRYKALAGLARVTPRRLVEKLARRGR